MDVLIGMAQIVIERHVIKLRVVHRPKNRFLDAGDDVRLIGCQRRDRFVVKPFELGEIVEVVQRV